MKKALYWIVVGGLAFWLPVILAFAFCHENVSQLMLNVAPLVGLILLALVVWMRDKRMPRWGWVLAGVYVLGPASILTGSAFARSLLSSTTPDFWFRIIAMCLFPPMTLWLSLLIGIIISVLFASVALLLLAVQQAQ